jgi:opacity protein-like surface antigen
MDISTPFLRSPVLRRRGSVLSAGVATTGLAIALLLNGHAQAADLSARMTAAPAIPSYGWSGTYMGANFGGAFSNEDVNTPIGISATNPSGALGGVQLGYNYQFSPWLLGVEAEFDWTSAEGTTNFINPAAALSVTSDHKWYDTLDGRLGYTLGSWLFYAKGGVAWMNADYRLAVNSGLVGSASTSLTRTGWNVGTGVEYLLWPRVSVKVEYNYLDFGTGSLGLATPFGLGVTARTQVNEVKAGLNVHWAPGTLFGSF